MSGLLRLRWHVAPRGYEIADDPLRRRGPSVVAKGLRPLDVIETYDEFMDTHRTYEARLGEHNIFIELARTACTPEGVLAFADQWGLPHGEPWFSLRSFYSVIKAMKAGIEDAKVGGDTAVARRFAERLDIPVTESLGYRPSASRPKRGEPAGPLWAYFEWEARGDRKSDKPRLFFDAQDLWQFCLLEHLHAIVGGVDIKACDNCGNYVRLPTWGGRPPMYCNDACRMAACRARKKRRKESSARETSEVYVKAHRSRRPRASRQKAS